MTSAAGMTGGVPALELTDVCRSFGPVVALEHVTLRVRAGSVHGLLGENGAGKTTLMRVAYGLIEPDAGEVRHFGERLQAGDVRQSVRRGIGMVQQQLSLVPALSAAENVALGGTGRFSPEAARLVLESAEATAGLRVDPDTLARDLSMAEQQRLEIVKALARGARLLILDEPTSGLAPGEVESLLAWIRNFADSGGTVVLVTHKLRDALSVADDITVLRRGRVVHETPAREASEAAIARVMFMDAPEREPLRDGLTTVGEPVVVATQMEIRDGRGITRVHPCTFAVGRGELLGVAAVEGSGHHELLAALGGRVTPASGTLRRPGHVALIPTNRTRDAVIPEFTLVENVALKDAGDREGRMPWRELTDRTMKLMAQFEVVAGGPRARMSSLSGGNQQRMVIARELRDDVDLVIADDPTRGLDLRASAFVHDQLRAASARGAAVVFHSSDLDELLALATRVVVLFHGRLREVPRDRDAVGRAMVGVST